MDPEDLYYDDDNDHYDEDFYGNDGWCHGDNDIDDDDFYDDEE